MYIYIYTVLSLFHSFSGKAHFFHTSPCSSLTPNTQVKHWRTDFLEDHPTFTSSSLFCETVAFLVPIWMGCVWKIKVKTTQTIYIYNVWLACFLQKKESFRKNTSIFHISSSAGVFNLVFKCFFYLQMSLSSFPNEPQLFSSVPLFHEVWMLKKM